MAIAPFLPGIFFFWSPSIITTPALSADSCPVLHGSVRKRVIAFFAKGGGGVGRRSLCHLTGRLHKRTSQCTLSPGGGMLLHRCILLQLRGAVGTQQDGRRRSTITTTCRGGWDACASTRPVRTDEGETAPLLAARLSSAPPLAVDRGRNGHAPREGGVRHHGRSACLHPSRTRLASDGGEPSGSSSPPPHQAFNLPSTSSYLGLG